MKTVELEAERREVDLTALAGLKRYMDTQVYLFVYLFIHSFVYSFIYLFV